MGDFMNGTYVSTMLCCAVLCVHGLNIFAFVWSTLLEIYSHQINCYAIEFKHRIDHVYTSFGADNDNVKLPVLVD